jgi:hypothetical protein
MKIINPNEETPEIVTGAYQKAKITEPRKKLLNVQKLEMYQRSKNLEEEFLSYLCAFKGSKPLTSLRTRSP